MRLIFVRIEQEKRQKQDNLSNGRKWQVLEHPSFLLSMVPVPTASAGAQLHSRECWHVQPCRVEASLGLQKGSELRLAQWEPWGRTPSGCSDSSGSVDKLTVVGNCAIRLECCLI